MTLSVMFQGEVGDYERCGGVVRVAGIRADQEYRNIMTLSLFNGARQNGGGAICKRRNNPRRWRLYSIVARKLPPRCKLGWNIISFLCSIRRALRNNVRNQLILQHRDFVL